MNIPAAIRDALLRHIMQAIGSSLVTAGVLSAPQADSFVPIGVAIIGAMLSAVAAWWGGQAGTQKSLITASLEGSSVVRDQSVIVVNDKDLAAKTPTEVVYGHDMSIQ
jgi:hypothetical protein